MRQRLNTLAAGLLAFTILHPAFAEPVAQPLPGATVPRNTVVVGGTGGFAALANPHNSERLRATHKVGLYIHNSAWQNLPNDSARAAILRTFQATGPQVVEIGAAGPKYWELYYKKPYLDAGVHADQAHVDGTKAVTLATWREFVDAGRTHGVKIISPIFTPNGNQWKTDKFTSPKWAVVKAQASYGGGITIDSPSDFFLANPKGYQDFVEDEIRWAKASRIQAAFIISPGNSGKKFLANTQTLIAKLAADRALPDFYIVENYHDEPVPPTYLNMVGSENAPNSVTRVALWIAEKAPGGSTK